MATTSDFRKGITIELDGKLFTLIEFQHVKPGKGGAFVRTKLKDLETGAVLEKTFRAGERIKIVRLEEKTMQYIYKDSQNFYFMDKETYEQFPLPHSLIKNSIMWLKEGMDVRVVFTGEKPVELKLPTFCELKVTETEPGVKGDTAQGGSKPAILETGAVVTVPLFVNIGDAVKIDTRDGKYMERVK